MVTEIIKREEVLTYCDTSNCFNCCNNWIKDGITHDAVWACRYKWNVTLGNIYSHSYTVRNKDFNSEPIQPISKW